MYVVFAFMVEEGYGESPGFAKVCVSDSRCCFGLASWREWLMIGLALIR